MSALRAGARPAGARPAGARSPVLVARRPPSGFVSRYPLFMAVALAAAWVLGPLALSATIRMSFIRWGADAHAYWSAVQRPLEYVLAPRQVDAFLYSPVVADLVRPLGVLPWPAFWLVWVAAESCALAWLLVPLRMRWAIPCFLLCTPELMNGNVYLFMAVALVAGMRHPAGWLVLVLTKIVAGVGLLWFAATGEWRRLGVAVGVLAAVVLCAVVAQPADWVAWVAFLARSSNESDDGRAGLLVRLVLALLVVLAAALLRRRWLLPVAMVLANPIWVLTMLTMLAAIPRLNALEDASPWAGRILERAARHEPPRPVRRADRTVPEVGS